MKKPKKELTTYELATLIIEGILAGATLITAIRWW